MSFLENCIPMLEFMKQMLGNWKLELPRQSRSQTGVWERGGCEWFTESWLHCPEAVETNSNQTLSSGCGAIMHKPKPCTVYMDYICFTSSFYNMVFWTTSPASHKHLINE